MIAFLLALAPLTDDSPTYERDVRPILARKCVACHQAKKVEKAELSGGLSLDSIDAIKQGVAGRPVVTPGDSAKSPLFVRLIDPDEDRRMPQLDEPLAERDREIIRRWIDAGAARGAATDTTTASVERAPRRPIPARDVTIPIAPVGAPKDAVLAKVGPLPAVTALAFSPDGRLLAAGTDGRVVLWDVQDRRPVATIETPGAAHALAFNRDGRRLAIGSGLPARIGSVHVVSVPDGTLLYNLAGHTDAVYAVAFRPDGAQLATAGFDATVRLWNLADGSSEGIFTGHSDFIHGLAYAPDGKSLLSASKDRSVKRFHATTREGLRTYGDGDQDVLALAIKPDGSGFVSAGEEPRIRWWRNDGERPSRTMAGHGGPIFALAFSGDGKTLISASGDATVRLWDGTTGAPGKMLPGATEWQYAAAISSDGTLAAAGGWDGMARVWDVKATKLVATLLQPPDGWLSVTSEGAVAGSDRILGVVRRKSGGTVR